MMEFEEEHEEEEEEEEEEESEMAITTPPFKKPSPQQPPPTTNTTTTTTTTRYRECLKNHAVGLGGHAVDGCGEFMPAGVDGSLDALRCAACNCHRNFHRKEFIILDNSSINTSVIQHQTQQLSLYPPPHHRPQHPHQIYQFYPYNRTSAGYLHVSGQRPLALPSPTSGGGCGGGTHNDRGNVTDNINNNNNHHQQEEVVAGGGGNSMMGPTNVGVGGGTMSMSISGGGTMLSGGSGGCSSSGKKRFRTKFTQEQKDKMLELAEKLGWRIQKQDDVVVQQFCHETGVKRHVLKVWMHNNKHTLGKKP